MACGGLAGALKRWFADKIDKEAPVRWFEPTLENIGSLASKYKAPAYKHGAPRHILHTEMQSNTLSNIDSSMRPQAEWRANQTLISSERPVELLIGVRLEAGPGHDQRRLNANVRAPDFVEALALHGFGTIPVPNQKNHGYVRLWCGGIGFVGDVTSAKVEAPVLRPARMLVFNSPTQRNAGPVVIKSFECEQPIAHQLRWQLHQVQCHSYPTRVTYL
ncbi:hypothetical protein BDR05DRAFT_946832 [Suillus weaverae]|nr:hypothetical protein BDR05DRAFT_946832 [Suillus weaverae]